MPTCPCCDCNVDYDIVDLIYIDGVYKCPLCVKNERQAKSDGWPAIKDANMLLIQSLITEIDSVSALNQPLMLSKLTEIQDMVNAMKKYVQ